MDFPGSPGVKNPPCSARDAGSILGQGTKISHAEEKLSPHCTPEPSVHNKRVSRQEVAKGLAFQLQRQSFQ